MASTATVTGVIGPAVALTAKVFTPLDSFSVDIANALLTVVCDGVTSKIDITGKSTFTVSISSGVYTIAVS